MPTILIVIIFALLGWLVGILINHLGNVLPLNQTIWQTPFCKRTLQNDRSDFISTAHKDDETPSEITYCQTPRPPLAWSGLLAYLSVQQHCTNCGKVMGLRFILVEVITSAVFIFLALYYGVIPYLGLLLFYTAVLILLTVTDLEHRLIQNRIILPAILIGLVGGYVSPFFSWQQALVGAATGFITFYILALLARGSLGFGDVTLATFLGAIIAFPNVIMMLTYGILLGGIVSFLLVVIRKVTMKTFIPYGPFLIIAGWVVLVWGDKISPW